MADAERQEAPRARQETLRQWWSEPPCPGSAVRAPANVAATSGTFPQLRERSRSFPKGASRFSDGRHRSAAVSRSPPLGEFREPCFFRLHAPKTPVGFMGLINFDTPSLLRGGWEHVRSGSPVSGSTGHVRAGSAPPSPVGQLPPHRDSLRRCHPHSGLPAGRP